jgi:hypothetical protein
MAENEINVLSKDKDLQAKLAYSYMQLNSGVLFP